MGRPCASPPQNIAHCPKKYRYGSRLTATLPGVTLPGTWTSWGGASRYLLTLELTKNGATPPLFPHTAQYRHGSPLMPCSGPTAVIELSAI